MEKELYVLYDTDGNAIIGEIISEEVNAFRDINGVLKEYKNIYDKVNPGNNVFNFIEYLAEKFQNKFLRDVSVWHEDYEFKIQFTHDGDRVLDDIEDAMNDALEDWWSVQWGELEYNSIQVKHYDVIVSFKVHDVHEVQFKYNDERR